MFQRLFRASRLDPHHAPSPGDGLRVYAIGDVHGCLDELDRLLAAIDSDIAMRGPGPAAQLVFLGDLVDRGPNSAGVIERLRLLAEERPGSRFLKGNHEELFLAALSGDLEALRVFCRAGGRETMLSYGMDAGEYEAIDYPTLAARLPELVPQAHRDFIEGFEDLVVLGDFAFVHAGVRPGVALEEQRGSDLRWIRHPFLTHSAPHAKMIVHGHTITDQVDRRTNRIGIDTGAYASGRLTALGLEAGDAWVLQT